jgi:membrane-bound lytic murein transglycosylase
MIDTLQSDIEKNQPIRLQDPKFVNAHFRAIEWTAFNPEIKDEKRLRITKYAVFTHPGSHTRTAEFNTGIYALNSTTGSEQLRLKYSKQDALANIYEPGGKEHGKVEPLAYLSRGGLESALMEGTILIKFTDGTSELFNVDRNNGSPYVKGVEPSKQKRYWYFKKVNSIKGYGRTIATKISVKPGVTFAGDVLNIGLGKMVVTEQLIGGKQQLRLGIIADTGGAFLPNLHQLDFLAGVFENNAEYVSQVKAMPDYAKAYILIKR